MRYIVVSGGVISGIGKGITASSIGALFQGMGYVVTMQKIDPYLNLDAGTMSPAEHGECFVTASGAETDLDVGNYERFLNIELTGDHNLTTGKIYQRVIEKERRGEFLGATVQMVPHVVDEIIDHLRRAAHLPIHGKVPDICVIELGGSIGDLEGAVFVEAIQQMRFSESSLEDKFCFVHVAMAIALGSGPNLELKTKPIQHSIITLRSKGIFPDQLIVRAPMLLPAETKMKLQRLCQIQMNDIISNPNVDSIYSVPTLFLEQGLCDRIGIKLGLATSPIVSPFQSMLEYHRHLPTLPAYRLAIVGKYVGSSDAYLSLSRAIEHAAFALQIRLVIDWIDAEADLNLDGYHGFIIPGGFGSRGIPGKLGTARFARENEIPILGICLGFQVMVVDWFNSVSDVKSVSSEWKSLDDELSVIDLLPDQNGILGGTMRLGNWETTLHLDSKVHSMYGSTTIVERHRHRYEVNLVYQEELDRCGIRFVGTSMGPTGFTLMEILEHPTHPFYIGCQFHPEYRSSHLRPHPLFVGLFQAMMSSAIDSAGSSSPSASSALPITDSSS